MRILIAEDSLTQAVDLRRRLESLGHDVVVASNGLEAWERLCARPESLVITDWLMPELSGLDLCRKIRAEIKSAYVYLILLTAKTHRHERLQGLQAGADDFLSKPIDNVELEIALKTARRIIEAHQALEMKARELQRANEDLAQRATLDERTGLKNANGFRQALAGSFRQAIDDGLPLSLMHLRIVPSPDAAHHGEPPDWAGAAHLAADIVRKECRTCDIAGRLDELGFGLILPGLGPEESLMIGDMVRTRLDEDLPRYAAAFGCVGVATLAAGNPPNSPSDLTAACEAAMAWALLREDDHLAHRECAGARQAAGSVAR